MGGRFATMIGDRRVCVVQGCYAVIDKKMMIVNRIVAHPNGVAQAASSMASPSTFSVSGVPLVSAM
jgi:hypothetical protein